MIQEANLHWRYTDTVTNLIMPWYVLPCLEWLNGQGVNTWNVFEYGGGYSTIWWRANALTAHAVDADAMWAKATGAKYMPAAEKDFYVSHIERVHIREQIRVMRYMFDCIVVDGLFRADCVEYSAKYLRKGGVMIIDNYEQPELAGEFDGADWPRINTLLEGWEKSVYKQPNHSTWQTAVFKKP